MTYANIIKTCVSLAQRKPPRRRYWKPYCTRSGIVYVMTCDVVTNWFLSLFSLSFLSSPFLLLHTLRPIFPLQSFYNFAQTHTHTHRHYYTSTLRAVLSPSLSCIYFRCPNSPPHATNAHVSFWSRDSIGGGRRKETRANVKRQQENDTRWRENIQYIYIYWEKKKIK